MTYTERDTYGMYKQAHTGPGPELMGAHTLTGDHVHNQDDEHIGSIKEIMLDMRTGRVAYAVMTFGGVLGVGEKLFAVPWDALKLDTVNKRLQLNVSKERVQDAPGFDKDDWPDMADPVWENEIQSFYKTKISPDLV